MEACPLAQLAVYIDPSAHGIHNVFGDGHAQTAALGFAHPHAVLPDKGLKNALPELLGHADAGIRDDEVNPNEILSLFRGFLVHGHIDLAPLGGKLHRVAKNIQQHLVQAYAVTAYVLRRNIVDGHIKLLVLGADLGLDNTDNAFQHLPQGNLIHAQGHLSALDLGHVQYVVDKPQQMPPRQRYLLQTVLHLLLVAGVGDGDGRHAYNGVHGRTDVVAHVGEEFALGLVGSHSLLPSHLQLLHLLLGHPEIAGKNQQQHRQHNGTDAKNGVSPAGGEALDNVVQGAIGHTCEQMPLGVAQLGAVQLPGFAVQHHLRGVVLRRRHRFRQRLNVQLRILSIHLFIDRAYPVKIAVPGGIAGADDKRAILPDDKGIDVIGIFLQRQCLADVRGRQSGHNGHAGMLLSGRIGRRQSQKDYAVILCVSPYGHLFLAAKQRIHEGLRVRHLQRRAIEHLKGSIHPVKTQIAELPRLGAGNQTLLLGGIIVNALRLDIPRQRVHLVQTQPDGGFKMTGDLVAQSRHIHTADLADGAGALPVQENGKKRKSRHAENKY